MNWPIASLGQLTRMVGGGTPSKKNGAFWNGGAIPWVSPKDMSSREVCDAEDHITDAAVDGSATQVVPTGSVLIVVRSGILVRRFPVAIARQPVALNQDMKALLPGGPLTPEFLAYALEARAELVLSACVKRGATVHSVDIGTFNQVRLPVPPPSEQRRIVELLDQADELRQKRAAADAKAERILPALFYKTFGDPTKNLKGWRIQPLGTLGELERGKSQHRPRNDPRLLGGPYPFIQTGDVVNSRGYIRTYSSTYSEFGRAQSLLWPPGTLCITIAANIAATAILGFDACFPDSVVGFKPGPDTNAAYIRVLFHFLRPSLEQLAPRMAQKNINLEILRNLPVPIPPKEEQDQFLEEHDRLLSVDLAASQARSKLNLLWSVLLHDAFCGRLTAEWRKAHKKQLEAEMEEQMRILQRTASLGEAEATHKEGIPADESEESDAGERAARGGRGRGAGHRR